MDLLEGTFLEVNVDRLDVRIDIFNLVVRLTNVQQPAFPVTSLLHPPAAPAVFVNVGNVPVYIWITIPNKQKLRLSQMLKLFAVKHDKSY
jgi:hypothetical protein